MHSFLRHAAQSISLQYSYQNRGFIHCEQHVCITVRMAHQYLHLTITIINKITEPTNDGNKALSYVKSLAINILRYIVIKEINDGLGIKSMAGIKTFVKYADGHTTFAHPLKFNKLFTTVNFLCLYDTLKFTFCPEIGKHSGYHPVLESQFR